MSNAHLNPLARVAVVAAMLVVPWASAFADEQQYYANPMLPHPEITGPRITRADVRVVADATNPHPELRGQAAVAVATQTPSK